MSVKYKISQLVATCHREHHVHFKIFLEITQKVTI